MSDTEKRLERAETLLRELDNLFGAIKEQEVKHDDQGLYAAIPLHLVDLMAGLEKEIDAYFAGAGA